jgi:putative DNA methylase
MSDPKPKQVDFWGNVIEKPPAAPNKNGRKAKSIPETGLLPEKLGKAIRLPVPDFSDPNRKPTCLEVDFPIAQINALSNLEDNGPNGGRDILKGEDHGA